MYSRMTAHIKSRKAFFCTCATSFLPQTAGKEKRVWPPKVTASISIISYAVETCQRTALRGGFLLRFWCFKREKVSVWELSDVRVLQSQNTDCRQDRPGCVLNRSRVFGIFRAKKVLPLFSAALPVIDPIPGQKLLRLFHTTFGNVNGFRAWCEVLY